MGSELESRLGLSNVVKAARYINPLAPVNESNDKI